MPRAFVKPELLPAEVGPGLLCQRRYQGHRKGCPNYGKRDTCPPHAEQWNQEFVDNHLWVAVWNKFAFGDHVKYLRRVHPAWTRRQLECCLYWQPTARKRLKMLLDQFMTELSDEGRAEAAIWKIPEAHGVNVTQTMASIGVFLEWPPIRWTYQVALVSFPRLKMGA